MYIIYVCFLCDVTVCLQTAIAADLINHAMCFVYSHNIKALF